MPTDGEHSYQVTIRTEQGNITYNVNSPHNIDDYQRGLLAGFYTIIDPIRTPVGEAIRVTTENLVRLTETRDGVTQEATQVGEVGQESARTRELLDDNDEDDWEPPRHDPEYDPDTSIDPNFDPNQEY